MTLSVLEVVHDALSKAYPDARNVLAKIAGLPKPLHFTVWSATNHDADVILEGTPEAVQGARELLADKFAVTVLPLDCPRRRRSVAMTVTGKGGRR
jgi:hypothetical protein